MLFKTYKKISGSFEVLKLVIESEIIQGRQILVIVKFGHTTVKLPKTGQR